MTFAYESTMSGNIRQILYDLNIEISELAEFSLENLKKLYYNKWYNNVNNEYLIHSKVIFDLIVMKEGRYFKDFDIFQYDLMINFLCTL